MSTQSTQTPIFAPLPTPPTVTYGVLLDNGDGFPISISLGSAGTVLTSGGAGVKPTFAAASGGSSKQVFSVVPDVTGYGVALALDGQSGLNNATSSIANRNASMFAIAGTLKTFRVKLDAATNGTEVYTLYKNGSATTVVVTVTIGQTGGVDNTHTVAVVAGDFFSVKWTGDGDGPNTYAASIEFDPS